MFVAAETRARRKSIKNIFPFLFRDKTGAELNFECEGNYFFLEARDEKEVKLGVDGTLRDD